MGQEQAIPYLGQWHHVDEWSGAVVADKGRRQRQQQQQGAFGPALRDAGGA